MKKIIYIFLIVHCTLAIENCLCQVSQQWVARYNGQGNSIDVAYSIAAGYASNVYVTGSSYASGTSWDYATVKYNSAGVQTWVRIYNGPGNSEDRAYSIAVDGSGNVYVTGSSRSGSAFGTEDYATIKYNSAGVQGWVARYNGPGNSNDQARSIAVDGSGNVYVTGWSTGSGTGYDYATIKYNTSGVQQWVQRLQSNLPDYANSLTVDGSGNVYVTGISGSHYATIKYNSSGVQQWVRIYVGPANASDLASSIAVDASGNVYVTGQSAGSGTGDDYATIKYNSSGVQQWVQRYNGPGNGDDRAAYSLAVDGSGNVYVTGYSYGSGTNYDYATIKYNSAGVQQWVTRYNGPGNGADYAYSLAVDGSGNVYVTGYSEGSGTSYDYATIKYNSSGVQQWVQRYNGPGNSSDIARSLAIDGTGNVYVTGESGGSVTGNDYATIKYSQPVGITPISNQLPEAFGLEQNYPNPFNPTTKIKFNIPLLKGVAARLLNGQEGRGVFVQLIIYDALGREVETLVNEQLNAGTYEVDWNASNYTSGIYFYSLISDGYSETRKMVCIK